MRVVAILASYNEQRFIRVCLEHYLQQGIEVYLLDNDSTDSTVDIAREYLGLNLISIERMPRRGVYQWKNILMRKEQLADEIQADWLMHADPDEIRVAPESSMTLVEALTRVDKEGYNAVNFMEYTFLPVRESPDHDHDRFQRTMRWYYPFAPRHPHRLNAWKKQHRRSAGVRALAREWVRNRRWGVPAVNLHSTGGHVVQFPGVHIFPIDFKLKHYIVLSLEHAIQKYIKKKYDPKEMAAGDHGWRGTVKEHELLLPSMRSMRIYTSDDELDASSPLTEHLLVETA